MSPSVYVESTVVSYHASRKSRDLVVGARQLVTDRWWNSRLSGFAVYISQVVLEEIARGDSAAASRRLAAVEGFAVLRLTDEALALAQELLRRKAVPREYPEDAAHIAVASAHGMDYLVTWNFTHINNAERKHAIERIVTSHGLEPPVICSPEELMGGPG
jgi:predicted nucleic acid-binding protein